MASSKGIDEQTAVRLNDLIILRGKKEKEQTFVMHNNLDKFHRHYAEREKHVSRPGSISGAESLLPYP